MATNARTGATAPDNLEVEYKDKAVESRKALTVALILVALGVLGTFPIFFEAFAAE